MKKKLIQKKISKNKSKDMEKTETKGRVVKLDKILQEKLVNHEMNNENNENINNRQPCNFFKLIVNPQSFTETIENIFDISFLIKEGKIMLNRDEPSNQPMVEYVDEYHKRTNLNNKKKFTMCNSMGLSIMEKYN